VAVDGDAVDLIDTKCARRKRCHRNRRRHDRVDMGEYFQE